MILDFGKPKRLLPTKEHNQKYQSDSGVAGTYVPNMSVKDRMKWKAKRITGKDPRIEIRKTVSGVDPSLAKQFGRGHCSAQVLIIVRNESLIISSNGRVVWDCCEWDELNAAIEEARSIMLKLTKGKIRSKAEDGWEDEE